MNDDRFDAAAREVVASLRVDTLAEAVEVLRRASALVAASIEDAAKVREQEHEYGVGRETLAHRLRQDGLSAPRSGRR